jgi:integrase/recombinase XerD
MYDLIYSFRQELENLGYSKSIVNSYPKYVKSFLIFNHELPENISEDHIKNYSGYLQEKPNKRRQGKLSQSYIHSQQLAIKGFFNYLERTGQIKQNPFTLQLKSPQYQERNILSQQQIQILYKHCQSMEQTIILHLCYGCGLRRSEAVNITVKDIDLEQKLLYVRKGKNKKRRVIPITQSMANDFRKYLESRKSPSFGGVGQEALLLNKQNKKMTANTMYLLFKNLLKTINNGQIIAENYCLHSLRHSIASHLLENEINVEMVRDFLGHSRLSTTQIYTRVNHVKHTPGQ